MLEDCSSYGDDAELGLILLGGEIVKFEIPMLYLSPIRKEQSKEDATWAESELILIEGRVCGSEFFGGGNWVNFVKQVVKGSS